MENLELYLHIPFCLRKCPYCDFYSEDHWDHETKERFVRALCREIDIMGAHYGQKRKILSIYFGGGTPTLLAPDEFEKIMEHIRCSFRVSSRTEVSMECNPATAGEEKLRAYKEAGLNRLSIGVQSFDSEVLKILGRLHNPAEAAEAVEKARRAGLRNISLDLMFGIPGQSYTSWLQTVGEAIRLKPKHISFYSLEFMDGTPFERARSSGRMQETPEEDDRLMYASALKLLEEAGLHQYEISNAAKDGFRCVHNLGYWNMTAYLGFGPSAHSFIENVRFSNTDNLRDYLHAVARDVCGNGKPLGTTNAVGGPAAADFIKNTYRDNVAEFLFTGLRKNEGISRREFEERFGKDIWEIYPEAYGTFMGFVHEGFAVEDERGIRLTLAGMNISNRIMALFV